MDNLVSSFQTHIGLRGVHIYSEEECKFLPWNEVIAFTRRLPDHADPEFANKLVASMANYDPDNEFLAVQHADGNVSIELYSRQP